MSDSTFDITTDFSEPYFTGSGAVPDEWALPVGIDGRGFLLDLASDQFQRRSVDLLNTQDSRSAETDRSATPPEVWRRVMESWHQGADQARFDREDSLPYRFNKSVGIDPWKRFGFELLNDTKPVQEIAAGAQARLEAIGRTLLVAVGTIAFVYPDVVADVDDYAESPLGADVVDTTADGEHFYVLTSNGAIHRYSTITDSWDSGWGSVPALDPAKAMIEFVKGFVLVGNGPDLWDYTDPNAAVKVFTHRLAAWHWKAACEGLTVIYVLGGMGDRWHVHRVGIKDTGAGLDPPIVAASLPEGEIGYEIASYLGYVLIGCSTGFRFGMPDQTGAVTYGQLVETPAPVRCFEGQDRFVWFGLSQETVTPLARRRNEDRSIYTDFAGLGRMDLSTFVAPMTPAAASDLRGVSTGTVTDVVTVGNELDGYGWRVFTVSRAAAPGRVWLEIDDKVPAGWLRTGTLSFNSNDRKMGLYVQAFHEPLHGTVVVRVGNDRNQVPVQIGLNDRPGTVTAGNMPYPVAFSAAELDVLLIRNPDNAQQGPRVSRMEFRVVNIPGRATEWRLPIMLAEDTNFEQIERTRDVREDYDFLMELVQTRRPFAYREGDRQWRLHATDFIWQPHHLVQDRSTYQGTFLLVAREYN